MVWKRALPSVAYYVDAHTHTHTHTQKRAGCVVCLRHVFLERLQTQRFLKRLRVPIYVCMRVLRLVQPYEEVSDLEQLQGRMVQSLGDYNARSRKPMDLVMFMFAVEHVSRLAR